MSGVRCYGRVKEVAVDWLWLVWLGLAIVFAVLEIFTLDLLFAMLAVGSLAGMIVELADGAPWLQIVVAALVAILLVFALRRPLLRVIRRGGSKIRHNVDAIAGLHGVIESVADDRPATAKLENGEIWSARAAGDAPLSPGDRIMVVRVVGATVEVEPAAKES